MPSPVGHLLAGVTVAWAADAVPSIGRRLRVSPAAAAPPPSITGLALACALFAVAPDADILFAAHRTYAHSIGAAAVAAIVGGAFAASRGWPAAATGLACGMAAGSHVALDWLGHDTSVPVGLMALWPFTTAYFYSGLDLFADVSRRYWKPDEFIIGNALSIARELIILAPPAAAAWWWRRRRLA